MLAPLKNLLDELEQKLDYAVQQKIIACHKRALNWEETDRLPLVVAYPYPTSAQYRPFPHHEIFSDPEKMLFNELVHAFDTSIYLHDTLKDDLPYTIRANFGTVLVASLLGGRVEQRGDAPPWILHFDTQEEFMSIFNPDAHTTALLDTVCNVYRMYLDILADYPNVKQCLHVVLPDLQGPLDTLELLRGSEVYLDFMLDPELTGQALALIAEKQIRTARTLEHFVTPRSDGFSFQQAVMIKGNILIRNDSAIMISPDMYRDQVAIHDEHVLAAMQTGGVHSCGKIDMNVPEILNLPSIRCFDFGQSYMNDVESVYPLARDKQIPFIRIRPSKEILLSDKLRQLYPTGVSLVYDAASYEEACFVSQTYNQRYGHNW